MPTFRATLDARTSAVGHYLCVGLDPDVQKLPSHFPPSADGILAFNRDIINATADIAACYKPNFAFYEALGPRGMEALLQTIASIPPEIPVIGDAKRGDIGNSSEGYARAAFEVYGCGAVTVNPYQGEDAVTPFLQYADRTTFLLARTSNIGSHDFQDALVGDEPLYMRVVRRSQQWMHADRIGYVVGANQTNELRVVRQAAPHAVLLVPAVGAQGGDARAAVTHGVAAGGGGLVVSVSRAILYASSGRDFAQAAREAARFYAEALRAI